MIRCLMFIITLFVASTSFAQTLTFGIVPQQSASRLAEQWTPIMDYLSETTGIKVVFSTAPDIPTFEQRLANGMYDIAYMNPYHYTVFSHQPGYRAIVKAKDKQIRGIIVARKNDQIESLEQLDNSKLAFPSPAAFAATILTQSDLNKAGINYQVDYVSSHDSVYLGVAKGFYPAGGGVVRTFNSLPDVIKSQLKLIWKTDPYTPHAIAVHPRLSADLVNQLQSSLLALVSSDVGKDQLAKLSLKGFVTAQDKDWDDIRKLNITILD
ncbi:phosphate/phosphite/phosphonate ABC transporter substrate-binding protein [Vibrio brasiliensis]|uniref:phosphate/phosphite/phosphonate ABC transporter substrate-binding protein n=1 Tax=Vibrio brasiliensis TaxID=170652 RepID=UPI001EFE0569|nr:phosphate/phosphite/phosphonate ABC transporter substrate-binding protein [Vibrio brasiliensis]MCG9751313.1 phosphate/phosphite/phosphonate ABC transporter substrate-binding protein [Vibrio brasiliensis]MCG9783127.1 phosphate/phosphite/phosphonate ABC transporter substrate-binding protein [Vibrio brasiliensis]